MQVLQHLKDFTFLRIYSFLTFLLLSLSIVLSTLVLFGIVLIQELASMTIVVGTILELFQILIVLQLANKKDRVGWFLHRFSYVTLSIMIFSFLSIFGSTYLSSFSLFGGDVMICAVIGYTMQASFGICLASITYHLLQIEEIWYEL